MIVISTKNSSAIIALGAGASFTGLSEDVSGYGSIRVVLRGTALAPGSLFVGFSPNGTLWTETETVVTDPATQAAVTSNVENTYLRVRYVNGATPHTSFRIQTTLYGGDSSSGGAGGGGGGGSAVYVKETVTISGADITSKSFALSNIPSNPAALNFEPFGGIKQRYGVDFSVSGSTVSWSALGLDGFLEAGDVIEVSYFL